MPTKTPSSPRVAALVGPYLAGKTSLLEALLLHAGALPKKGSVKTRDSVGDAGTEARARGMSTELTVATCEYLGEAWTFIDCPGSVEFQQDGLNALQVSDIAVVVVEPEPAKALCAAPILKMLDERKVPHVLFINKCDQPGVGAKLNDVLAALQAVSDRPLVLRELPIKDGANISGFVDLVSERAWGFKPHEDAQLTKMPDAVLPAEGDARREMLEHLADFDDHLMEELLEDIAPATDEVYANLKRDLAGDLIVPVLFGSAEEDHGIRRLFKMLRHEAPNVAETAARLGIPDEPMIAQVFKSVHAQHIGKQSIARIWRGEVQDGQFLGPNRVSGVQRLFGAQQKKLAKAGTGEIVALGRMDDVHTGQALAAGRVVTVPWPTPLQQCFSFAVKTFKQGDDVKLGGALLRICEEDPSLGYEQSAETHEMVLWGQGEIHLRNAIERLKNRFGVEVKADRAQIPYKETLRKPVLNQHGRYKHQTGGHGAFGDVYIDIKPQARGAGYSFNETVVGGAVPRQFFSSVENGAREFLKQGPLGFELVDIAVTLTNGSYHAVDSSDMAFKAATRIAMTEGTPNGAPVLLEPVVTVQVSVPSDYTARAQRMVTGRRGGQIQGYDGKPGWNGWDIVNAQVPLAEIADLILELRSLTMGVGSFTWAFSHLAELDGREGEQVVKARKAALSAAS